MDMKAWIFLGVVVFAVLSFSVNIFYGSTFLAELRRRDLNKKSIEKWEFEGAMRICSVHSHSWLFTACALVVAIAMFQISP